MSDEPLGNPESEYCIVDNTIEQTINFLKEDNLKNIGIVGSYGAGKTTVLKTVEKQLNNNSRFIFSWIDSWGREPSKLDEQIIGKIINSMKENVDVSQLIFTPEKYSLAMKDSHWFIKTLNTLNSKRYESMDIILKINQILEINNKKLIVFLEDLDRNNIDTKVPNNVLSLLDRFSSCDNIALVLTINADALESSKLYKVSEYILGIKPLDKDLIGFILNRFKELCTNRFKYYELDNNYRMFSDNKKDFLSTILSPSSNKELTDTSIFEIMALQCNNIRNIKVVLRHTLSDWENLYGEVNLNDLFICNLIKYTNPEIFNILISNYNNLIDYIYHQEQDRNLEKTFMDKFKDLIKNKNIKLDKSIFTLIGELFTKNINDIKKYTQRIAHQKYGKKYWNRIINSRINKKELLDQDFLERINKKINKGQGLSELLEELLKSEAYRKQFDQFGKFINRDSLKTLVNELIFNKNIQFNRNNIGNKKAEILKMISEKSSVYQDKTDPNTLKVIRDNEGRSEHRRIGEEIIKRRINKNLNFCNYFFETWYFRDLFTEIENYYEIAKKHWINNPKNLLNAIAIDKYYSLYHFIIRLYNDTGYETQKSNRNNKKVLIRKGPQGKPEYFDHTEFKWLKNIIIQCFHCDEKKMIPVIMCVFLYGLSPSYDRNRINKNHKIAIEYFTEEVWNTIMHKTANLNISVYNISEEDLISHIRRYKDIANEYIKNYNNNNDEE